MLKRWDVMLAALLLFGIEAQAHRLKVFASAAGDAVEGYAYFPGGGAARGCRVEIRDGAGAVLGVVTTDQEGAFTYTPSNACTHVFVVSATDGHRDTFRLKPEGLPGRLAEGPGATADDQAGTEGGVASGDARPDDGLSEAAVDRIVTARLRPLHEEVEALRTERRASDVIGGIGFIVGLFGLIFFYLSRRGRR